MLQADHMRAAETLARELNDSQLAWVSGYFAAKVSQNGSRTTAPPAAAAATILFGSETGNGKAVAQELAAQLGAQGIAATVADMANYKTAKIKREKNLLAVVSTHGDGDPPEPALPFFNFLLGSRAPKLPDLHYSVLCLGDSSYEHFCHAGGKLDDRFAQLGAQRLAAKTECDIDFEKPAQKWRASIAALLGKDTGLNMNGHSIALPGWENQRPRGDERKYGRKNPFTAAVLANICLTGDSPHRKTHHIELSLENAGMAYEPGDSLGVWPKNPSWQVRKTAKALGMSLDEPLTIDDEEAALEIWLRDKLEISQLTQPVLKRYSELCRDSDLSRLASDRNAAREFAHGRVAADLFSLHPLPEGSGAQALATLRRLTPRLYSLASSNIAWEDEAHLLVGVDKYSGIDGSELQGVASGYLSSLAEGDSASVYLHSNDAFRLPENDSAPIIMIGPGTGVAPFRAFMAEREERGARGKNWLFFGEQRRRNDFYYQSEWQVRQQQGLLHELNVAFSRDRKEKVYVQHKMREQSGRLWQWLQDGAHVYVCGNETRMARDVEVALVEVIASEGAMAHEAALEQLEEMRSSGRYCRDVY